MSEREIQVILVELQHVRKEIAELKEEVRNKCNTCLNSGLMEQDILNLDKMTMIDSKKLWMNIHAQWVVFGAVASALLGSFLVHVLGR
ncbi:MAG: hypothetical protein P4N59_18320 [Negativicutes bacterium]|nr:hypothetical protein [Negativicutes bacterium]